MRPTGRSYLARVSCALDCNLNIMLGLALKIAFSVIALVLAVVHVAFPGLAIDFVTVSLLVIAGLPWIAPLVDALEMPGGWRFEFKDFERTKERAEQAGLLAEPDNVRNDVEYSFQVIADTDPNLALAGLRIEIEQRLVRLAEQKGIGTTNQGIGRLMNELTKHDALTGEERSILSDLLGLLNAAVHGENRNVLAAHWALDVGPRLLESLDSRLKLGTGRK